MDNKVVVKGEEVMEMVLNYTLYHKFLFVNQRTEFVKIRFVVNQF